MYSRFNLKLTEEETNKFIAATGNEYELAIGEADEKAENIKKSLQRYLRDIEVDGDELETLIFPTKKCDVFISYSHNDEELAKCFAWYLKTAFGLDVFIDSYVWGSADCLLKLIDDYYSLEDSGNYNYRKRNLSTSHVHAMLSMAILRAMNKSEAIIFINTENSVKPTTDMLQEVDGKTYSPWIYEEITYANYLRRMNRPRQIRCDDEGTVIKEAAELKITHGLDFGKFTDLTLIDLLRWEKAKLSSNEHSLDVLYQLIFGENY